MELDVHLAKVATYTDRVIDAFYVRDPLGRKLEDANQSAAFESALRERLTDEPLAASDESVFLGPS